MSDLKLNSTLWAAGNRQPGVHRVRGQCPVKGEFEGISDETPYVRDLILQVRSPDRPMDSEHERPALRP